MDEAEDHRSEPLFQILEDGVFLPNPVSRGPWSKNALHGGPVAALLAGELDAVDADRDYHPARFTLELRRPVPLAPLHVSTQFTRPGKQVRLLEAQLTDASETLLATATLQQIRTEPVLPATLDEHDGDTLIEDKFGRVVS